VKRKLFDLLEFVFFENKIHFNLDGIDDVWKAVSDGLKGYGKSEYITSWELFQVFSNPDVLKRTVFYRNNGVVGNPFK
jgi:hypothetical protein